MPLPKFSVSVTTDIFPSTKPKNSKIKKEEIISSPIYYPFFKIKGDIDDMFLPYSLSFQISETNNKLYLDFYLYDYEYDYNEKKLFNSKSDKVKLILYDKFRNIRKTYILKNLEYKGLKNNGSSSEENLINYRHMWSFEECKIEN